jgi:hypothetical protein
MDFFKMPLGRDARARNPATERNDMHPALPGHLLPRSIVCFNPFAEFHLLQLFPAIVSHQAIFCCKNAKKTLYFFALSSLDAPANRTTRKSQNN